jgi:hypothetical protein
MKMMSGIPGDGGLSQSQDKREAITHILSAFDGVRVPPVAEKLLAFRNLFDNVFLGGRKRLHTFGLIEYRSGNNPGLAEAQRHHKDDQHLRRKHNALKQGIVRAANRMVSHD